MKRDGHIRILPLHVANKIAAGEVVERPASALKELVENAIDAGADRIDIAVADGGRKLISVRDNGCGMSRDDALLSLERQATSKIRDVDDIEKIDTLGFRGEAVPSIASVSRFGMVTRPHDSESGIKLVVNAGIVAEVSECGAPPGTCVEVKDLFCNVPARKKFLRSCATEEGHIKSVFTISALAHPELGFSLTVDGRELHRFAPGATLEERISAIFGRDFAEELIPVKGCGGDGDREVKVSGYVSRPSPNPIRREQFVFVNGRPATAPIISYAINEAYPNRGESKPSLFLFIELPPDEVDVNVHPAKKEVRFRHPANIKAAVAAALTSAFSSAVQISAKREEPSAATADTFTAPFQPTLPSAMRMPQPVVNAANRKPEPPAVVEELQTAPEPVETKRHAEAPPAPTPATSVFSETPLAAATGPWRTFKVLATTESGYLLLETDAGIVTVNPQAAQERIAFEKLMKAHDQPDSPPVSQPLLLPETVQFSPVESARLKEFSAVLSKQGFEIEEFGIDTWKIDAVPALISEQSAADGIASIVYDIGEAGLKRGNRWREELIAKSVARSFAGASRKMTIESATKLIEELGRAEMPYVCPRGKPVMIFTSNRELARKFGG
jgi:DNA mismatch repair protein MutL